MSNNKQSSIEWLEKEINARGPKENNPPKWLQELYDKAKAMHKAEVEKAHEKGLEDGYYYDGSRSDWESEGETKCLAEQYYKETFKQNEQ